MDIRPEIRLDAQAIDEVVGTAFPDGGVSEVQMVHDLRANEDAFIPELSLVAVEGGTVVGHVLFTIVHYVPDDGSAETPILSLAPLAVRPSHHNQGIGGRLVDVGLRKASLRPEPFCVVLGHPSYYPRFGFEPAIPQGIRLPFDLADESAFMMRRLAAFDPSYSGTFRYSWELPQTT